MESMARARALMREAYKSAKARGHLLTPFTCFTELREEEVDSKRLDWHASCDRCGKKVHVITAPDPNEISIGGEAVALNCNS